MTLTIKFNSSAHNAVRLVQARSTNRIKLALLSVGGIKLPYKIINDIRVSDSYYTEDDPQKYIDVTYDGE